MQCVFLALLPTATATTGQCSSLGCTVHKTEGRPCQCNFHCAAHSDCCPDFGTVCSNLTDPCLEHKCGSHTPATDATAKVHEHKGHSGTSSSNSDNTTSSTKGVTKGAAHDKVAAAKDGKGKSSAEPSTKADSSSKCTHGHHDDGESKKGHHEHSAKPQSSGSASKSAGGSGGSSATEGGKESKPHEQHAHDHAKSEHEHAHAKHETVSLLIVLLACATGLTVPITISIILILRARGVCCAQTAVHHRIDMPPTGKPTETAAEGPPHCAPAAADDRELFDVPEEPMEASPAAAPPP